MTTSTQYTRFIEILWPQEQNEQDIQILQLARPDRPGVARLNKAAIQQRETTNGDLLVSWTGQKFGIVAAIEEMLPPFDACYYLAEAEEEERDAHDAHAD